MRVSNVRVRRRLFMVLIASIFVFLAMLIRLGYIQLWIGSAISEQAEDSWRRNIPFSAKRGEILDRNGVPLTYNVSTPSVLAIPAQIKDPERTASLLAQALGMSEKKVYETITKRQVIMRIQPEGRKIPLEKALEIRKLDLPGIVVTEDNKRFYPFGSLASHVLGFTGVDSQGLTGVELTYDDQLRGINGSISYLADGAGREMPGSSDEFVAPKDGLSLQLTIDKQIQSIVERELDVAMLQYKPKHAISVAMDPKTGEILAMAGRPTYNPEEFAEYPSEVYNRNLPIWMTYEPGSTFKIITLAASLEEGKLNLKQHFYDSGVIEVAGAKLHCWKRGGHGSETFQEVVENSCNPGFVVMGQNLGKNVLFDYIRNFGFGTKTGIDLRGEENGILFKLDRVGPVELATTSFGQGVSVTPIQQVAAVSAAINGGYLFKPHVAKAWINDQGEVVKKIEPELVRQVISEGTSKMVRESLEKVVAVGTGRYAYLDGYRVGGKTGTAQKVVNGRYSANEHIVSFVGFAPADDPQIVIYTAIDDPQGIQFGGLITAPIVRNMLADILPYLNVEPRKDQVEKQFRYGETPIEDVPNLVGLSVKDIYLDLNANFNLVTAGSGNTVISQAPKAGTRVERGSTIRVFLANSQERDVNENE